MLLNANKQNEHTAASATEEAEALFAEGRDVTLWREQTAFDHAAGALAGRIVLCGAGGFGRRTLKGLRKAGIEPLAFCDGNAGLWDREVDGLPVYSPEQGAARFGDNAVFVLTMWKSTPADRVLDRLRRYQALGCGVVVPFGTLYWKYAEQLLPYFPADLPHRVYDQVDAAIAASGLWADERSRREYFEQLRWRLFMDFEMGDPAPEPIYFPDDIIALGSSEAFVDCGAFDGDSIRPFLTHTGGAFERIYAFEPDPENFAKLASAVEGQPGRERIVLKQACVGDHNGAIAFSACGNNNSVTGVGDMQIACVKLDDVLTDAAPTYVKMDVEGAEPRALLGLARTIAEHKPKLAISAYHVQDHLWRIPLLIRQLGPDYRLFLRAHARDFFDLVCYAIP